MCPLQIINNTESLSSILHSVNAHFIYHPSSLKITGTAISQKPIDQIKKKKKTIFNYIFLHLDKYLWLKNQNTNGRKCPANFLHVQNLHLMAH